MRGEKTDSRPWALNEQLGKVEIGGRLGMSKPSQTKRGEEGEFGVSEYYTNMSRRKKGSSSIGL